MRCVSLGLLRVWPRLTLPGSPNHGDVRLRHGSRRAGSRCPNIRDETSAIGGYTAVAPAYRTGRQQRPRDLKPGRLHDAVVIVGLPE